MTTTVPTLRLGRSWAATVLMLAGLLTVVGAQAQTPPSPNRPIRIVIGFGPGTAMDTVARLLAERLGTIVGEAVVVENRAGASGNIASEAVAHAPPDGHTIALAGVTSTILPAMPGRRAIHPLRELTPVTKLTSSTIVFVTGPNGPFRSLADVVAGARRAPGTITYATNGIGTPPHLAGVMLSRRAGIELVHVPYSAANMLGAQDTSAGRLAMGISLYSAVEAMIRAGQLRPLAVTSLERIASAPDIPTVAELGHPGFEISTWYGIFVPAGTPSGTITRLHAAFTRVLAVPEVRQRLAQLGWDIIGNAPSQFAAEVQQELDRWPPLLRDVKLD